MPEYWGNLALPDAHVRCNLGCPLSARSGHQHLFDHLVGALLKRNRRLKAQYLGSLEIEHQLELDRELHRKLTRFLALQNSIHVSRRATIIVAYVISVGQQAASVHESTVVIDSRESVTSRHRCDLRAVGEHVGV